MSPSAFRNLILSLLSSVVLLGMVQTVSACSCGTGPTVLEAFERAEEVVILRVVSVEKSEEKDRYVDDVRSTTMIVERVFKGHLKVRDEIAFGQGGGADCVWTFNEKSIGHQFLFYLATPDKYAVSSQPPKDPHFWYAFACGRSGGVDGVTEDLLYLENIKKVKGKTRISGKYGGWQNPGLDVEGKKIKFIGPKKTFEAKTDQNGVFEIYGLPPGKYVVEPETPAGWKIDPYWFRYSPSVHRYDNERQKPLKQVEINLEPKKHASVDFVFEVDNSVRGRVLDPKGSPMHEVCVCLLQPDAKDRFGPSDCTDKSGRFEITAVPPGEYILAANADNKLSFREPFQRIFYAGVSEVERAAVISVQAGQTIENLDIVVPKTEETVTIEGVLSYSDGTPAVREAVKFKVAETNDKVESEIRAETDTSGRFTLRVIKGLTADVFGEDWIYRGNYKNCPKVDELLEKAGTHSLEVQTNVVKLSTEQNIYDVELRFPFAPCKGPN